MLELSEPQLTFLLALTTLGGGLVLAGWMRTSAKRAWQRDQQSREGPEQSSDRSNA